jgi:hypothetical protein
MLGAEINTQLCLVDCTFAICCEIREVQTAAWKRTLLTNSKFLPRPTHLLQGGIDPHFRHVLHHRQWVECVVRCRGMHRTVYKTGIFSPVSTRRYATLLLFTPFLKHSETLLRRF